MKHKQECIELSGEAFCPLSLSTRLLLSLGPILLFLLLLVTIDLVQGHQPALFVLSMAIGGFIGGGKLVILAGAVESAPVGVWEIAGLVVFGDVATALIILANMHHLYRVPALGRHLASAREAGFRVLKTHKWMRRGAKFGLSFFIAVPFQGTGAVLGVVLGRILGLTRLGIFASILVGSCIGCAFVALAGTLGQEKITRLADHPVLGILTVAISLGLTFLLGRWFLGQGVGNAGNGMHDEKR